MSLNLRYALFLQYRYTYNPNEAYLKMLYITEVNILPALQHIAEVVFLHMHYCTTTKLSRSLIVVTVAVVIATLFQKALKKSNMSSYVLNVRQLPKKDVAFVYGVGQSSGIRE